MTPRSSAAMEVAIVGSREFKALWSVSDFVRRLAGKHPDARVLSGAAAGVDQTAVAAARTAGLRVSEYPADWSGGRGGGFRRNLEMLKDATIVVAFWDGSSRGTAHMIVEADKAKKPLYVYSERELKDRDVAVARAKAVMQEKRR